MRLIAAILFIGSLVGCAAQPALIVGASTDSVQIQQTLGTKDVEVLVKGREACNFYKRDAVGPVSKVCRDQYCMTSVHLFMCRPR